MASSANEPPSADGVPAPGLVAELLRAHPPMIRDLPGFDPDHVPHRPGPLFAEWLAIAVGSGVLDPHAMTLSTVEADGRPDARVLILRGVDEERGGWVFAADAQTPKGRQLAAVPAAALSVYWPLLGRQVRVRGAVEQAPAEVSAAEFRARSLGGRIAGLVGGESRPMGSMDEYDAAVTEAARRLHADPGLVAPGHTVYTLWAREVEFWQGHQSRRHIRLLYRRPAPDPADSAWTRTLLWP
ncbi:pyridoxine/pyridoxamine 5'-phosphate oxidase [Streptomyces aidingensis]|uniref:Pyridoxamine 5'-phosphate oxidase n=1 Tax=Streptomyces aidingensis TaxID=910347 RepID=A0A1I1DZN9_9ACTN|nr:pyridoxal 5'-phosphate synthase [Streptomyces aidingensis]SFB80277.1 pyridoxamine 5'-phosphate oxidase [Streptomyces aidingensis]